MLIRLNRFAESPEREVTDPALYLRRREFVAAAGLAAGALLLPGCGRADDAKPAAKSEAAPGDDTPTPFEKASSYNNFYEFGTDKEDPKEYSGQLVTKPWSVAIEGEVAKPGTIALEDLIKPAEVQERIYRMRCVEAWSMVIPWRGVPLKDVLARFEPTSKAKYVAFTTLQRPEQMPGQRRDVLDWPYGEGLRIDEAMNPLTLLATGMYGRDLPNQNGAPLRLVVPWKYGFKGIKSIVSIRLVETQPPDHLEHRRADRVRLLLEREPGGRPPALDARSASAASASSPSARRSCSTATPTRSPRSTRAWTCARTSEPTPGAPRGGGRGRHCSPLRGSRSARCATTWAPTRSRPSRTRPGCGPCASCSRPWP